MAKLEIQGKLPPEGWKYLLLIALLLAGVSGGELLGLV